MAKKQRIYNKVDKYDQFEEETVFVFDMKQNIKEIEEWYEKREKEHEKTIKKLIKFIEKNKNEIANLLEVGATFEVVMCENKIRWSDEI